MTKLTIKVYLKSGAVLHIKNSLKEDVEQIATEVAEGLYEVLEGTGGRLQMDTFAFRIDAVEAFEVVEE